MAFLIAPLRARNIKKLPSLCGKGGGLIFSITEGYRILGKLPKSASINWKLNFSNKDIVLIMWKAVDASRISSTLGEGISLLGGNVPYPVEAPVRVEVYKLNQYIIIIIVFMQIPSNRIGLVNSIIMKFAKLKLFHIFRRYLLYVR